MFRLNSIVLIAAALLAPARAATTAADVAHQISQVAIDPDECYRVTELNFSKEDVHIYLTSGYLAFVKPIEGKRIAAVFNTDIEAGDGEVLVIPPYRGERLSLSNFTNSPTMEEHFKTAAMVFTDSTAEELLAAIKSRGTRNSSEMGAMLAEKWTPALRNFTQSFQVRLIADLLGGGIKGGIFYMAIGGTKLGNFDVIYDPESPDQIVVGQLAYRDNRAYFDIWTSFPGKKQRADIATNTNLPVNIQSYRIETTVSPDLSLKAGIKTKLKVDGGGRRVLPFWIAQQMRILDATVDGHPAEVFQRESMRATLIRGSENEEFLVVIPEGLDPSKPHDVEFRQEGTVITQAGDRVFFVNARGNWYPRTGFGFARYELSFKYPKDLVLVSAGEPESETTEGDFRISEFRAPSPIRFAGFNLGDYHCVTRERDGYKVNVCANQEIETALKRAANAAPPPPSILPHPEGARPGRFELPSEPVRVPPNPQARLQKIADDVAAAMEFYGSQFGPPPLNRLTVSPIPGSFGQGFPGLLYLSTLSYLDPSQRPATARSKYQQSFFSDVLDAHEVAHQWWGNLVISGEYQDDWIMEALADYSALMFLEKKHGPKAIEALLDEYRSDLLQKGTEGRTLESSGPITWGIRLLSSHSPESWRAITYEKGAWIVHMLRRRLGDQAFISMLHGLCEKYRFRPITTEQFRDYASHFLPPKSSDPDLRIFFENWVYATGIPAVKLTYAVHGSKLTGTLTTTAATDDFTGYLPVEVQQGKQKTTHWLQASSDGIPFSIALKPPLVGTKATLSLNDSLITKK